MLRQCPSLALSPGDSLPGEQHRWFIAEVKPHEPALRGYLHKRFPVVVSDMDDIVQESYLRLWRAKTTGRVRSARTYLFSIARNASLDVIRRRNAAPFVEVSRARASEIADPALEVRAKVHRAEERSLLAEALAQLSPRRREVVVLRLIHGLSCREIAQHVAASQKTVEHQLSRGLRSCTAFLQTRIGGLGDGPLLPVPPNSPAGVFPDRIGPQNAGKVPFY